MLAWLSVWSEVQTCIWSIWCHCHSLSLVSVKSRLVLPFWYRPSRVVLEKGPLNGCVYMGSPALASTSSWELEDFVGAKFYFLHALANGTRSIQIRKKMLEFSLAVLSTLSPGDAKPALWIYSKTGAYEKWALMLFSLMQVRCLVAVLC